MLPRLDDLTVLYRIFKCMPVVCRLCVIVTQKHQSRQEDGAKKTGFKSDMGPFAEYHPLSFSLVSCHISSFPKKKEKKERKTRTQATYEGKT